MHRMLAIGLLGIVCIATACTTDDAGSTTSTAAPESQTTTTVSSTLPTTAPTASSTQAPAPTTDCDPIPAEATTTVQAYATPGSELLWTAASAEVASMALHHDVVYVSFETGDVVAWDAADCALRWRVTEGPSDLTVGPTGVFAVSMDRIAALDPGSGTVVGSVDPEEVLRRTVTNPRPVGVFGEEMLLIVDESTLAGVEVTSEAVVFTATFDTDIVGVAHSDHEIAVSTRSEFALLDPSGDLIWSVVLDAPAEIAPTVDGGQVVVGVEGEFQAYDLASGDLLWSHQATGTHTAPAILDHDEWHILEDSGVFWHLALSDGTEVFVGNHPRAELDVTSELLVLSDGNGVHATTMLERTAWTIDLETSDPVLDVAVGDGFIVVVSG